jgi:hypothetical protein
MISAGWYYIHTAEQQEAMVKRIRDLLGLAE